MLGTDTEKAARELAKRIMESSRMTAFVRAKDVLAQDGEAQRILRDLEEAQDELLEVYGGGREASRAQIETIKRLQRDLQANPRFAVVARAQQDVQDLLSEVVEEISGLLGMDFAVFARSGTCC